MAIGNKGESSPVMHAADRYLIANSPDATLKTILDLDALGMHTQSLMLKWQFETVLRLRSHEVMGAVMGAVVRDEESRLQSMLEYASSVVGINEGGNSDITKNKAAAEEGGQPRQDQKASAQEHGAVAQDTQRAHRARSSP